MTNGESLAGLINSLTSSRRVCRHAVFGHLSPTDFNTRSLRLHLGINQFFEKTLIASVRNPRWSWGAVETFNSRVFLLVWSDHIAEGKVSSRTVTRDGLDGGNNTCLTLCPVVRCVKPRASNMEFVSVASLRISPGNPADALQREVVRSKN